MKIFLIFGFIGCLITGVASAASICANLTPSMTCSSSVGTGGIDWGSNCGNTVVVYGLGRCSDYGTSNVGDVMYDLSVGTTVKDNLYCWCHMAAPASSAWVFAVELSSARECALHCGATCASFFDGSSTFRSTMISSMIPWAEI